MQNHTAEPLQKTFWQRCLSWVVSLVVLCLVPAIASAESVTLSWQPVQEPDIAYYCVYYGTTSRVEPGFSQYDYRQPVGAATTYRRDGLLAGETYYFAVTCVDLAGQESAYSEEAVYQVHAPVTQAPTAVASADVTTGTVPLLVNFDASSSFDPDGNIVQYSWNFGDGEQAEGVFVDHTYLQAGSYVATLTLRDSDGLINSVGITIQVNEDAVAAAVNFQPANSEAPNGYLVDSGKAYDQARGYGWTGDGTLMPRERDSSVSPDQAHDTLMYVSNTRVWEMAVPNGTYEVTVCIGDPRYSAYGQSVQVEGVSAITNGRFNAGQWLEKTVTADVADGRLSITFTDAQRYVRLCYLVVGSLAMEPLSTAQNEAPVATASTNVTEGYAPLDVAFDASGSSDPGGSVVDYRWNFGDGATGTGMTITHTFDAPGTYQARLVVVDKRGLAAEASVEINVFATADAVSINFQPANSEIPSGFLADSGSAFDQARGYGWTGYGTLMPRERDSSVSPDQAHDTLMYVSNTRVWEMAVPNGTYEVTVCIGDPRYSAYGQSVQVEGVSAITKGRFNAGQWLEKTVTAGVADGKLSLTFAGASQYVRICYVVVRPLAGP